MSTAALRSLRSLQLSSLELLRYSALANAPLCSQFATSGLRRVPLCRIRGDSLKQQRIRLPAQTQWACCNFSNRFWSK